VIWTRSFRFPNVMRCITYAVCWFVYLSVYLSVCVPICVLYLFRHVTEYVTAGYFLSSVLTDLYLYLPWALRHTDERSWVAKLVEIN
jgi:hypothetical protein